MENDPTGAVDKIPSSYANESFIPHPMDTEEPNKNPRLVPTVILAPETANGVLFEKTLLALMDSGSTSTYINRSSIPNGCMPHPLERPITTDTAAGKMSTKERVVLKNINFPEFSKSIRAEEMSALVFEVPCNYDMIIGRDFLNPNQFDLVFSLVLWSGTEGQFQ